MAKSKFKSYKDIDSVEKAFELFELNPQDVPVVDKIHPKHQLSVVRYYILTIVIAAINYDFENEVEWEPNYADGSWHYSLWPGIKTDEKNPAGVGFSLCAYGRDYSCSVVGSRLEMRDAERVRYLYDNPEFRSIAEEYMLYPVKK